MIIPAREFEMLESNIENILPEIVIVWPVPERGVRRQHGNWVSRNRNRLEDSWGGPGLSDSLLEF